MAFDELDRTTRYIVDAKARASALLDEDSPKLTALEKAIWVKLKRDDVTHPDEGGHGDAVPQLRDGKCLCGIQVLMSIVFANAFLAALVVLI